MLTLAIDTATRTLAVALVQDQQVLSEAAEIAAQSHAERLPQLLAELMAQAQVAREQITQVAVGVGPGAYTGLRVGLMFATAFARAREIDLVGICTHDVIAPTDFTGLVITDARRKEVYFSQYRAGARIAAPIVIKPAEIAATDQLVIGDGVAAFPELFPAGIATPISAGKLGKQVNELIAAGMKIADIVPEVFAANSDGAGAIPQNTSLLLPALPLYLRRPDVMESK